MTTQPHIGQIIELRDGRRASVYRIQHKRVPCWPGFGAGSSWFSLFVVTTTGEKSEVYV